MYANIEEQGWRFSVVSWFKRHSAGRHSYQKKVNHIRIWAQAKGSILIVAVINPTNYGTPSQLALHCIHGGKYRDISAIYRRYIVYWEEATRYFMEKNRRGDISVNIVKISAIYRRYIGSGRYIGDFFKKSPLVAKNRWYIGDISEIYRWFFGDISPPSCNVIWRPRSRPCWSDGLDVIPMVIWRSNGPIAPSFLSNG